MGTSTMLSFYLFYRKPSAKAPVIDDCVGKCCSDNASRKSYGGTVRGNTSPDGRLPRRRDVKRRKADVDAAEAT
jgi:hypothetical protein